jgi:hypothetical protein
MIPLWAIKIIASLGLVTGAYFYWSYLNSFKQKYTDEVALHQAAANSLLSERLSNIQSYNDGLELEKKYNEITKKNVYYKNCIANGTCSISLRQSTKNSAGLLSETSGTDTKSDVTSGRLDRELQQRIQDHRTEIEKAQEQINGLQSYINKHCL